MLVVREMCLRRQMDERGGGISSRKGHRKSMLFGTNQNAREKGAKRFVR